MDDSTDPSRVQDPSCPVCGAAMKPRTNSLTHQRFWGCRLYPACRGSRPWEDRPLAPDVPTLHRQLRQVTRERDTLQAGYEQLLGEVRQLRRLKAPATPTAARLVRELTRVLTLIHPDKWGGDSAVALECTKHLVALRARIQEGRL